MKKHGFYRPGGYLRHPIRTLMGLYVAHTIDCQLQGIHPCGSAYYHDWQTCGNFVVSADIPWPDVIEFARGRRDHFRNKNKENY